MQILVKALLSVVVILSATTMAKRFPSLAGLVAVMPLTSLLVLVWIYLENDGDSKLMQEFSKGALQGIIPTVLFFLVSYFCFTKHAPLPVVLLASFGAWLAAALFHQWVLK
jgi:uncharacterized membrane protein (GlpM family)